VVGGDVGGGGGGDVGGGEVAGGAAGVTLTGGTGTKVFVRLLRLVLGDVARVVGAVGAGAGATAAGAAVVVLVVLEVVVVEDGAGRSTLTARTWVDAAGSVAVIRQATTATSATAVRTSSPFRKRSSGASR
jgi:hypothetical protein